jgi:hypothetical protein
VLYPNAKYKQVGEAAARQDVDDCIRLAEQAGAPQGGGERAVQSGVEGAAVGGAAGGVVGAIAGHNVVGSAVAGAALEGASAGSSRASSRPRSISGGPTAGRSVPTCSGGSPWYILKGFPKTLLKAYGRRN